MKNVKIQFSYSIKKSELNDQGVGLVVPISLKAGSIKKGLSKELSSLGADMDYYAKALGIKKKV